MLGHLFPSLLVRVNRDFSKYFLFGSVGCYRLEDSAMPCLGYMRGHNGTKGVCHYVVGQVARQFIYFHISEPYYAFFFVLYTVLLVLREKELGVIDFHLLGCNQKSLLPLLYRLFISWLSFESSLYIFDTNLLIHMCFSHSYTQPWLIFNFLNILLQKTQDFHFYKFNLSIFYVMIFMSYLKKKYLPDLSSKSFSPVFSSNKQFCLTNKLWTRWGTSFIICKKLLYGLTITLLVNENNAKKLKLLMGTWFSWSTRWSRPVREDF